MSASNLYYLADFQQRSSDETSGGRAIRRSDETAAERSAASLRVSQSTGPDDHAYPAPSSPKPQLRDLYPLAQESVMLRAFSLLRKAGELIDEAEDHFREGNFVACDDALLRVRLTLRETFLCRAIGQGFALVVGGLNEGLAQLTPESISELILRKVRAAVEAIRERPALPTDDAIELLLALDEVGLNTDMPELGLLAELGGEP